MADGKNAAILDFALDIGKALVADKSVPIAQANLPEVRDAVIKATTENPVVQNAFNLEGLANSRIAVNIVAGLLVQVVRPFGLALTSAQYEQWVDAGSALLTIGFMGYALLGRVNGASWGPIKWPWSA